MKKGILGFLFFVSLVAVSQQQSTFNDKVVQVDSSGNYSFIVGGHFYGNRYSTSGYPANSILANIEWINAQNPAMLICLGDLFMDVKNNIPQYEKSFFNRLNVPLFNAVGNHDLTADIYQKNFGATFFKFQLGRDMHVVLDTESDNGNITGEQLKLLESLKGEKYDHIFIYAHRTVWKNMYEEMENIFSDNTQSLLGNNYEKEVYPLLSELSKNSKVYWFSGSIGNAPASFFYHHDTSAKITYIATAIRGIKRDALLMVNVKNGQVSFKTHSLTGEDLMPLEDYNVEYWQTNSGVEPFNWRLLPLYIKQTVLSWSFWWGVVVTLLFTATLVFIQRRRNKGRKVK
ncbi:MAG: metallophosphoesterase [Crocinitomicaceae bacterium]